MSFAARAADERGISAIFFGLAVTVLVGGLGLSLDIGNVAYQRSKAQHAADSAARQIAIPCAEEPTGATCLDPDTAAATIMAENIDGAAADATIAGSDITVTVDKTVPTTLLALIGVNSKDVAASATASSAGSHVETAHGVLPLGVSYCTWKNNSAFAGTDTEADHRTALRTDTLQSVHNLISPLTGVMAALLPVDGIMNSLLGTDAADTCQDETNSDLVTLQGAVWLTGEHVVAGTLSGLFGWDENLCELNVGNDLSTFLGGAGGAAFIPPGCLDRLGPGNEIEVGTTILLPIYKPYSALQDQYGFKLLSACGSLLAGKGQACVEVPPKIGVEVVGYAPFTVTGWTYPGNMATDASVGCAPVDMSINVYNIVNGLLTVVERIVNAVVLGLLQALGLGGNMTASLACNGLQGYFTKTYSAIDGAVYGPGSDQFGASAVRLTQ